MTAQEIGFLLDFFYQGGYVLNFSNKAFSIFTMQSVGVDLQGTHGGSKGSSLITFTQRQENAKIVKLFSDLLEYYELRILDSDTVERRKDYKKCRSILDKYKNIVNSVNIPTLKEINSDYIRDMAQRAQENISLGYFDSALTQARTLLEDVLIYVIEKEKVEIKKSGDINVLYNQVKTLYHMHNAPDMDKRINGLLSGLNSIVYSIGEMRNKAGDAHGHGSQRKNIRDYHARLYVNSAMTIADFILSVGENRK